MAAFLRKDLVLDLKSGRARPFQHLHGTDDVHRISKAGVGIDQERQRNGIGDCRDVACYFRQRGQPNVRRAKTHVRDAGPRHIDGFIAEILDNSPEQAVRGACENCRLAPIEYRFKDGCRSCHATSPVVAQFGLAAVVVHSFRFARRSAGLPMRSISVLAAMATTTMTVTTAVDSGTLFCAMPLTSRKPRPRCDENISPINTPSRLREKLIRRPLTISGRHAGTKTQRIMRSGESRNTLDVRISTGGRFRTAPSVNRVIGTSPCMTPKATLAD